MEEKEPTEQRKEKQPASDNDESSEKKNQPSKRQLDHLKYAREMKRLKKEQREHEVNTQTKNLDFIYKRLTNIEKDVQSLVESQYEPRTTKRKASSRHTILDDVYPPDEESKPKKKIQKTSPEESKKDVSYLYDTVLPFAGKALLISGGTMLISLLKNYAAGQFTTTDRDQVGGYYFA